MANVDKFIMKSTSKAVIYWALVVAGSFMQSFFPLPHSYFSNKNNVFNVYMVKFSWGWTVSALFLYLVVSASSYRPSGGGVARLLVATFSWYFWVNFFIFIEDLTAVCEGGESFTTRSTCKSQGFYWNGFDISGHTFLLIHCCLVMSEELQPLKHGRKPSDAAQARGASRVVGGLGAHVWLVVWCIVALEFLWEFMLVCTAIYFHTVYQKILAAAIAIANWWLTYQWWYQCEGKLSPRMPK